MVVVGQLVQLRVVELFLNYIEKYPATVFESFCILIPLIIGAIRWALLSKELKLLWGFPLLIFLFDIPLWIEAIQAHNNYMWINIQEIITVTWLYYVLCIMLQRVDQKMLWGIYAMFAIIIIWDFNFTNYSGKIFTFNRIILIGISFVFFYQLLAKLRVKNLLKYALFWFFTGLMIHSLGTLLMYVFTSLINYESNQEAFNFFSKMKETFKYIFVLLMSFAFWLDGRYKNNMI